MKKFFLAAFLFFSLFLTKALFAEAGEKSVIAIEQAQKVENSKDPVSGEDCIILTGSVKISVSRGSTKTTINAERINYNRATEMLFAEGSVSLEQTGGSQGGETITASSLLFNTATLEGVFDNGRAVQTSSDAINLPSGSTLIVASDVFGRDSGGTIAFKSGELTFCDDENPHWRIRATRIWLLPGGEFAFLNATLFVGFVPLLYLPAFYYPKDELLFNPTFGYRQREGYYINTTTYLYGRKGSDALSSADINAKLKSSSSSSSSDDDDKINFFSFMNTGSMKEQRREGLVLHNLDEDYSGNTSNYFKVMADYYANMGTMVGFDGTFAPGSVLTSLTSSLQLGFSNTIFRTDSIYIPKNAMGEIVQDKSNFLGKEFPFRYQGNFKFTIAKPFSLTLALPLYSDPFFNYDFGTRAETMDWIDFAMSGGGGDSSTDEPTITETSSFTWSLNGSYTQKIPEFLNPFISSLSLSSFGSSIVFSSKANEKLKEDERYKADTSWATYTPERKFYYPSQITPFKTSARFSGTLVQIPYKKTKKTSSTSLSLTPPEELDTSEKENKDSASEEKEGESQNENEDAEEDEEEELVFSDDYLPLLDTSSFSCTALNGISYSLGYSISPDFTSQFSYSSAVLKGPEDFVWDDMQSTYIQVKSPATLTSKLGYRDSFISLTDTFTFNPVYQSHPYLKITETSSEGGYTESSAKSVEKADYNARKMDLTDVNALTFKPFALTKHFSETSLTWNTTVKMIRTKYTGADEDSNNPRPEWEYEMPDLTDEECLTVHNLNFVLGANQFDKQVYQTLSLTTTLPPQVDAYSGTLTLGFPYIVFTCGTGIKQKSKDDETWVKDDFTQSLSINMFSSKLKLSQSYVYDLEEKEHESFKLSLSGFGLQAAYTSSYVSGYEFKTGKGWVIKGGDIKEFQPYQFSLSYSSGTKSFKHLKDRITYSPSLSTSAVYDFVRPTNSYLRFTPAFTFKVNDFLNITFSAETKNSIIFRYFCSDDDYNRYYGGKGERNVLQDLMDSFRFDSEEKRKASAFKLQTLKIDVTHDLDDWDLNCSFSVKPRLMTTSSTGYKRDDGKSYYDFSPYFSISVAWRPLASMKTQIVDEYGEWKLNP